MLIQLSRDVIIIYVIIKLIVNPQVGVSGILWNNVYDLTTNFNTSDGCYKVLLTVSTQTLCAVQSHTVNIITEQMSDVRETRYKQNADQESSTRH